MFANEPSKRVISIARAVKIYRKGIGNRLLREIIRSAENKGVSEIHVVTEFKNKPAINLYKKHGLMKESLQLEREFV